MVFELVTRIEAGRNPVPIVRRIESGISATIYEGPECVSLEQAVLIAMNAYRSHVAPASKAKQKPKNTGGNCVGRGLPEGRDV